MTQAPPGPVPETATITATSPDALRGEIQELSAGNVVRISPDGPEFAHPPRTAPTGADSFVRQFSRSDRLRVALLSIGWLAGLVWFWAWWLRPEHRVGWVGLILNSALLVYLTVLPFHFVFVCLRMRRFNPAIAVPCLRTAFVVTRAPSEHWEVARTTLRAMLDQRFPHPYDVWLCDESPTEEIVVWCRENGVGLSCREGNAEYHRSTWPRRTRCKEGNLAHFYDRWGYENYDVVAQLDCDHVPEPHYLVEVVRPFADPAIGYVAAPSVCDSNAAASWSARGRLYREAVFHGAFQLGHSEGYAPLCIGSHYAVRTQALREVGGIGPELAEDFSTTFLLNSAGWHGAFAIDAEAHGEGPLTFAAMATQEFQWSRSLAVLLFGTLPKHMERMSRRLRLRFGLIATYYPLLAMATLGGLALPPIAAATGGSWINVNYFGFLGHFWAMSVWLVLLTLLARSRGLLRPHDAPVFSWEQWLFVLARWPFVIWGIAAALLQRVRPRPTVFKVTPKSRDGLEPLPLRLVLPYVLISLGLSAAAIVGELTGPAAGYVFLSILGSLSYAVVALAVSALHVVEAARGAGVRVRRAFGTAWLPLLAGASCLLPLTLAAVLYPVYLAGVLAAV
ncbi:glycosyltransferase family 2 protein [Streptomyces sp. NPDC012508]|uniref:glycosyltransferase family 2 protein n=1 Tax=Streptomyces sp. NPDC012508 TaxID=3364837 RepID=UPI00367D34C5